MARRNIVATSQFCLTESGWPDVFPTICFWFHLVLLGLTWVSLGPTWTHLPHSGSIGLTWAHLDSLDLPHKGKGKTSRVQREKGKGPIPILSPDLTRQSVCASSTNETTNETKRFTGWAHPPTSDIRLSVCRPTSPPPCRTRPSPSSEATAPSNCNASVYFDKCWGGPEMSSRRAAWTRVMALGFSLSFRYAGKVIENSDVVKMLMLLLHCCLFFFIWQYIISTATATMIPVSPAHSCLREYNRKLPGIHVNL